MVTVALSFAGYGGDHEGVLEVTDAVRFLETLTQGMGRGKAFGLGMMTVIYHG